ncbi:MAG: hypothetical protein ACRBCS_05585 [Cellvibrionaceae bacterium]
MKKYFQFIAFLVVVIFTPGLKADAHCESPLMAEYQYEIMDTEKKINQKKQVVLWRRGNQVVIQTPRNQQAELWELTPNRQIKMTRYFENHQRGIEYQPTEIKNKREKNDWSFKYQLVSDVLIRKMQANANVSKPVENIEVADCNFYQKLSLTENKKIIDLTWNPIQKLMTSLEVKEGNILTLWSLTKNTLDADKIDQYYEKLLSYQTTDYADVGDNESDPFLMKMIHLGFVEHGASGFYDSEGNNISRESGEHGRHGH